MEREITADREFRRAVAYGIDLESIMSFRHTFAAAMNGPVLPSMWGSLKDVPKNSFNTAMARSLLDSLGWKLNPETNVREQDGKELELELLTVNSQNAMDLCHLLARDLERVGIKVDIRTYEFGTYWATLKEGDFDLFIGAENAPTRIDFDNFETPTKGMEGYNFTRYSNPEVDRLILATRRATSFVEVLPLYEELQRLIVADQPVIWLYQEVSAAGIANYLHDVEVNAADPFFNVMDWWTETCTRKPDAERQ
jgi:peptide/nickel transport system substrate-binding protein